MNYEIGIRETGIGNGSEFLSLGPRQTVLLARRPPGLIHFQYPPRDSRRGSWFRPLQHDRVLAALEGDPKCSASTRDSGRPAVHRVLLFGKDLPDVARKSARACWTFGGACRGCTTRC